MISISKVQRMWLGYQGENISRQIEVDVNEWLDRFPDAIITLVHKRHGEDTLYPTAAEVDEDGVLVWTPTSADTHYAGDGIATALCVQDDIVKASRDIKTVVTPNVVGAQPSDPPAPSQSWVNTVLALKTQAAQAATDAETAQAAAEAAQTSAAASAAEAASDRALVAEQYMPPYLAGDCVLHSNGLYRAKVDIPSGEEWTASHWDAVTVMTAAITHAQIDTIMARNRQ